ncbi:agmatinase [Streptosporangium amethystogenes]|uniref:agmatinase n=1 Tax=Streptosporangium amethystogenes TaxID=2002 RepID=UPI0004CBE9F9|nr:agmatinase [Streptosporangium amethystogenes]
MPQLSTFMGLPYEPAPQGADLVIVGAPYDGGTSYRPGARFGPRAIREESALLHGTGLDRGPSVFGAIGAVDAGDLDLNRFSMESAMSTATERLTELAERNQALLMLGGDHSMTLAALRAAHKVHGPVAVLHLDAHSDTYPPVDGGRYHHGTPFRWAIWEKLVDPARMIQVGIRGHVPYAGALEFARARGVRIVTAPDIDRIGVGSLMSMIQECVGDGPLYVSCDIDVVDPAFAPGTGTPSPGGLSSRELLAILRGIGDLQPIGCDVVEVAPAYDHGGATALLAAEIGYELIYQYARSRRGR